MCVLVTTVPRKGAECALASTFEKQEAQSEVSGWLWGFPQPRQENRGFQVESRWSGRCTGLRARCAPGRLGSARFVPSSRCDWEGS